MRCVVVAIGLGMVWPAALQAQEQEPVSREVVQASIDAKGAGDQFSVESDEKLFHAVHARSGLVCLMDGTQNTWVEVVASTLPRGDDIACHSLQLGTIKSTIYASRLPGLDIAEIMAGVRGAVEQVYTTKPYTGLVADMSTDSGNMPESLHARYEAIPPDNFSFPGVEPGAAVYTSISIARVGDWVFKQRVTAPLAEALFADVSGGVAWLMTLEEAVTRQKNGAAP